MGWKTQRNNESVWEDDEDLFMSFHKDQHLVPPHVIIQF